jgi:hypothetical protein
MPGVAQVDTAAMVCKDGTDPHDLTEAKFDLQPASPI